MKRSRGTREGREADQDFGAAAKGFEGDVHASSKVRRPLRIGELPEAEKRVMSREPFDSLGQHAYLVREISGA